MKEGWEFITLEMRKYCSFEIIGNRVIPIPMVAIKTNITSSIVEANL